VDIDVLNTSVVGSVANSSLPSIEVLPPSNGFNVTWSALLMNLEVTSPNLLPFTHRKQLLLTALTTQVSVMEYMSALFFSFSSSFSVL